MGDRRSRTRTDAQSYRGSPPGPKCPDAARSGRSGWRPRYPEPVDTPDRLVSDGLPVTDEDPLIRALREENERLRAQNRMLTEQMAAVRAAQDGARQAPEGDCPTASGPGVPAAPRRGEAAQGAPWPGLATSRHRQCPDAPSTSPMIRPPATPCSARTREWLAGRPLLPEPDIRPVRTGCAGRVLVIVPCLLPRAVAAARRPDRADPGAG